jgi:hypothetical protein
MAYAKGKISKIFIKAKDAPDQYGNTHRAAVKIEEVGDFWIGMGDLKGDKLTVQMGAKNWVELTEGSVIEFMYTEKEGNNGNVFRDAKRSGVKVLELAPGGSPKPAASRPATSGAPATPSASTARTGASSGPDWAKKDAGAAASASVDKAIAYLTATNAFPEGTTQQEDIAKIKAVAREMQWIVLELANEILVGNATPKPNPVAPVAAQPTTSKPPTTKPKNPPKVEEPVTEASWENEDNDSPF